MARPTKTSLGLTLGAYAPNTPILPALTGTPKIWCGGDSTTAGTFSSNLGSYRYPLGGLMDSAGDMPHEWVGSNVSPAGFWHYGNSSWTIAQLTAQIATQMATHVPDIIILQIGRNDMTADPDAAAAPGLLTTCLAQFWTSRPTARVIVCHPTSDETAAIFARTQAYRAAIPGIIQASSHYAAGRMLECRGGKCLAPYTRAYSDGVHPNDGGYLMEAQEIFPVLRNAYGLAASV
jgi:lysophospholipase L1-like esterase